MDASKEEWSTWVGHANGRGCQQKDVTKGKAGNYRHNPMNLLHREVIL